MRIATFATIWFAAAFAIAQSQTCNVCTVGAHILTVGATDLDADYLLTGPDLMLVPYDPGILEA